jgi:hypothetical protein
LDADLPNGNRTLNEEINALPELERQVVAQGSYPMLLRDMIAHSIFR